MKVHPRLILGSILIAKRRILPLSSNRAGQQLGKTASVSWKFGEKNGGNAGKKGVERVENPVEVVDNILYRHRMEQIM